MPFIKCGDYIKDIKGETVKQKTPKTDNAELCPKCMQPIDGVKTEDLTVGMAVVNSLSGVFNDKKLNMTDKMDRFALAVKLHGATLPVEISNTEKKLLLEAINDAYSSPIVVSRVNEAITEKTEPNND